MPTPKVRALGQVGVVTDIDPFDLPPNALSYAQNVRFRNNRISSAPVFKNTHRLASTDPRFLVNYQFVSGVNSAVVGYLNGRTARVSGDTETDVSPVGFVDPLADSTWSAAYIGDLAYINRGDRPPWYMGESDTNFHDLSTFGAAPDAWPTGWTTNLLRTASSALVALGVTKNGIANPTMVKTSSFVLAGAPPASWDFTNPATNATENILAEMKGPIIDACPLGNDLIIYGNQQAYRMTQDVTSGLVWDFFLLPFAKGSISANCSVEVNGRNYVFGPNDIWVHDGITEQSICDQRVRDFIFSSIDLTQANRCFVTHNEELMEVVFAFVSDDGFVSFPNDANSPSGCNRAAVYCYATNTWTFDDLPYVHAADRIVTATSVTYATTSNTYEQFTASYLSEEDTSKRRLAYVGDVYAAMGLSATLYAFDFFGTNGAVNAPVDTAATPFPYMERTGIDLDELGLDLQGYKQINYLVPQGRIDPDSPAQILFSLGASDGYNDPIVYNDFQGYDGNLNYKIDANVNGRYLSLRIRFPDFRQFTLSGFDLDIQVTGLLR